MDLSLDLTKIFPLTFSELSPEQSQTLQFEFARDWGFAHLHFFPMVLREKKYPLAVVEIADYEFQTHFLQSQSFSHRNTETGNLVMHASCQFIHITAASRILQKKAGLYVIWKSAGTVQEKRLEMSEAELLDRLREDLPVYPATLNPAEQQVLQSLMALGIVIENRRLEKTV